MKFKVTYYKEAKALEKEIEANRMFPAFGEAGSLIALFTNDVLLEDPKIHSAFSDVISVEKIEGD